MDSSLKKTYRTITFNDENKNWTSDKAKSHHSEEGLPNSITLTNAKVKQFHLIAFHVPWISTIKSYG